MREPVEIKPQFIIEQRGKRYVLYAGLLDAAHRSGLQGMTTELIQIPGPDNAQTAITRTTVTLAPGPDGEPLVTTGLGDASPTNVAKHLVGCIIRMSETRSKARALRDAINVDVCAVEELDEAGQGDDGNGDIPQAAPPAPNGAPAPPAVSFAQVVGETVNVLTLKGYSKPEAGKLISEHVAENDVVAAREFLAKCRTLAPTAPGRRVGGPAPAATPAPGKDPITPAQRRMLEALADQSGTPVAIDGLTRVQASQLIDKLKAQLAGGAH